MSNSETQVVDVDRQARIRRVVESILTRRAAGESISDDALCQEHAELLPELAGELRKLGIIQRGREQSEREEGANSTQANETAAYVPTRQQTRRLARSLR